MSVPRQPFSVYEDCPARSPHVRHNRAFHGTPLRDPPPPLARRGRGLIGNVPLVPERTPPPPRRRPRRREKIPSAFLMPPRREVFVCFSSPREYGEDGWIDDRGDRESPGIPIERPCPDSSAEGARGLAPGHARRLDFELSPYAPEEMNVSYRTPELARQGTPQSRGSYRLSPYPQQQMNISHRTPEVVREEESPQYDSPTSQKSHSPYYAANVGNYGIFDHAWQQMCLSPVKYDDLLKVQEEIGETVFPEIRVPSEDDPDSPKVVIEEVVHVLDPNPVAYPMRKIRSRRSVKYPDGRVEEHVEDYVDDMSGRSEFDPDVQQQPTRYYSNATPTIQIVPSTPRTGSLPRRLHGRTLSPRPAQGTPGESYLEFAEQIGLRPRSTPVTPPKAADEELIFLLAKAKKFRDIQEASRDRETAPVEVYEKAHESQGPWMIPKSRTRLQFSSSSYTPKDRYQQTCPGESPALAQTLDSTSSFRNKSACETTQEEVDDIVRRFQEQKQKAQESLSKSASFSELVEQASPRSQKYIKKFMQTRKCVEKVEKIPVSEIPKRDIPPSCVPKIQIVRQRKEPQSQIPQSCIPQSQIPQSRIPQSRIPQSRIPQSRIPQSRIPQSRIPQSRVPQIRVSPPKKLSPPTQRSPESPQCPCEPQEPVAAPTQPPYDLRTPEDFIQESSPCDSPELLDDEFGEDFDNFTQQDYDDMHSRLRQLRATPPPVQLDEASAAPPCPPPPCPPPQGGFFSPSPTQLTSLPAPLAPRQRTPKLISPAWSPNGRADEYKLPSSPEYRQMVARRQAAQGRSASPPRDMPCARNLFAASPERLAALPQPLLPQSAMGDTRLISPSSPVSRRQGSASPRRAMPCARNLFAASPEQLASLPPPLLLQSPVGATRRLSQSPVHREMTPRRQMTPAPQGGPSPCPRRASPCAANFFEASPGPLSSLPPPLMPHTAMGDTRGQSPMRQEGASPCPRRQSPFPADLFAASPTQLSSLPQPLMPHAATSGPRQLSPERHAALSRFLSMEPMEECREEDDRRALPPPCPCPSASRQPSRSLFSPSPGRLSALPPPLACIPEEAAIAYASPSRASGLGDRHSYGDKADSSIGFGSDSSPAKDSLQRCLDHAWASRSSWMSGSRRCPRRVEAEGKDAGQRAGSPVAEEVAGTARVADVLNTELLYYAALLRKHSAQVTDACLRSTLAAWVKKLFGGEYHATNKLWEKRNRYLLSLSICVVANDINGIFLRPPPEGSLPDPEVILPDFHASEKLPIPPPMWEMDDLWEDAIAGLPDPGVLEQPCGLHHTGALCPESTAAAAGLGGTRTTCPKDEKARCELLDRQFRLILSMAKCHAALFKDPMERTMAASWLQALCAMTDDSTDSSWSRKRQKDCGRQVTVWPCRLKRELRNEYAKTLLGYLNESRLAGPFLEYPPNNGEGGPLQPLRDAAKACAATCKDAPAQGFSMDPTSPQVDRFLAKQPLPQDGAFCYIAISGDLLDSSFPEYDPPGPCEECDVPLPCEPSTVSRNASRVNVEEQPTFVPNKSDICGSHFSQAA